MVAIKNAPRFQRRLLRQCREFTQKNEFFTLGEASDPSDRFKFCRQHNKWQQRTYIQRRQISSHTIAVDRKKSKSKRRKRFASVDGTESSPNTPGGSSRRKSQTGIQPVCTDRIGNKADAAINDPTIDAPGMVALRRIGSPLVVGVHSRTSRGIGR